MSEMVECESCGREFVEDSEGNEYFCGGCYYEKYCFTCSWCEEDGDVEDQHTYVLVFDACEAGVRRPGLYRVTNTPYYAQGLIGGGMLFASALTWVGDLPDDREEPDGYPCGHACATCQRVLLAHIDSLTYMTRCAGAALAEKGT